MLDVYQRDAAAEIMWVCLGGVVGALPASAEAIVKYAHAPYVFSISNLVQIGIFLLSLGALVVSGWLNHSRKKKHDSVIEKIRAQKKVRA